MRTDNLRMEGNDLILDLFFSPQNGDITISTKDVIFKVKVSGVNFVSKTCSILVFEPDGRVFSGVVAIVTLIFDLLSTFFLPNPRFELAKEQS